MTPERETSGSTSGDRGVFGNLPSERPGVRSPRRSAEKRTSTRKPAQAKAAASKPRTAPKPSRTARPRPPKPSEPPRSPSPSGPPPSAESPEPASSRRGVEDVAWAGVTVAAEAATLGVRLFSRALEAVRERR